MPLAYLCFQVYPWEWLIDKILLKTKTAHIDQFTKMKNMKNIKSE